MEKSLHESLISYILDFTDIPQELNCRTIFHEDSIYYKRYDLKYKKSQAHICSNIIRKTFGDSYLIEEIYQQGNTREESLRNYTDIMNIMYDADVAIPIHYGIEELMNLIDTWESHAILNTSSVKSTSIFHSYKPSWRNSYEQYMWKNYKTVYSLLLEDTQTHGDPLL